jgi:TonB family protein
MKFCLDDGSPLVAETASGMTTASGVDATLHLPGHATEQPPTVLSPQQTSPPQSTMTSSGMKPPAGVAPVGSNAPDASKARFGTAILWVVAAVIIGVAATAVAFIITRGLKRDENVATGTATASPSEVMPGSESSAPNSEGKPASVSGTTQSNQPAKIREPPTPTPTPRRGVATVTGNSISPETNTTPPTTGPTTPRAPISGGVLNGKAVRLVTPTYPPIAKAAHASGAVTVRVLIDENGNVVSASAVSGHPLLQASAVSAARQSNFTPTKLSGQPVKVTGVIVYNFVAQ